MPQGPPKPCYLAPSMRLGLKVWDQRIKTPHGPNLLATKQKTACRPTKHKGPHLLATHQKTACRPTKHKPPNAGISCLEAGRSLPWLCQAEGTRSPGRLLRVTAAEFPVDQTGVDPSRIGMSAMLQVEFYMFILSTVQ